MLNGGMSSFFPIVLNNAKIFYILTRHKYNHVNRKREFKINMKSNCLDLRLDINGRYVQ